MNWTTIAVTIGLFVLTQRPKAVAGANGTGSTASNPLSQLLKALNGGKASQAPKSAPASPSASNGGFGPSSGSAGSGWDVAGAISDLEGIGNAYGPVDMSTATGGASGSDYIPTVDAPTYSAPDLSSVFAANPLPDPSTDATVTDTTAGGSDMTYDGTADYVSAPYDWNDTQANWG